MTKRLFSLAVVVLLLTAAVPALAAPVPSRSVDAIQVRAADLATINSVIGNEEVSAALAAQGFTSDQVNQRIAALSDEDLRSLASNLDQVQAAGMTKDMWIWIGIGALAVLLLLALT